MPTNDGDRCSILLTITERLANNSPSTYYSDSPSKRTVAKIDHSYAGLWGTSSVQETFDIYHFDMRPKITLWSVQPTGSLPGNSPTATLTIPTCPAGFAANIPGQLLWLAGTASGLATTVYGYGEYVMTTGGGSTCLPGVSNGTVNIKQVTPGVTNIAAHDHTYSLSNQVGPFIEDSLAAGGHIHDVRFASDTGSDFGGNMVQVGNDQSCAFDNMNMTAGFVTRNDNDFQASGFFAPGPSGAGSGICSFGPNLNISGRPTAWRGIRGTISPGREKIPVRTSALGRWSLA